MCQRSALANRLFLLQCHYMETDKRLLERTLVLLKPDAIHRGIVGEVLQRFERVGAKMAGLKLLVSAQDTAMQHYTEDLAQRRGEKVREMMIQMITSGPIIAIV